LIQLFGMLQHHLGWSDLRQLNHASVYDNIEFNGGRVVFCEV
jgi:hypothetical protein